MADENIGVRVRLLGRNKFTAEAEFVQKSIRDIKKEADEAGINLGHMDSNSNQLSRTLRILDGRVQRNRTSIHGLNTEVTRFSRTTTTTETRVQKLGKTIDKAGKSGLKFGGVFRLLVPLLIASAIVLLTQAVVALGGGFIALAGALAPATGALIAYPAIIGTVVTSLGLMKFATAGLAQAVGGLNKGLNYDKLKLLSGGAQQFAKELNAAKGPVLALRSAVGNQMFPGLTRGLRELVSTMPTIQREAPKTGKALGHLFDSFGQGAKQFQHSGDMTKILRANAQWTTIGGRTLGYFGKALANVLVTAIPFITWMARGVEHFAIWTKNATEAGRSTNHLDQFFRKAQTTITKLVSIVKNLAIGIYYLASAGAPLGQDMLTTVNHLSYAFKQWAKSDAGRARVLKFFKDIRGPLHSMGQLFGAVSGGLLRFGASTKGLQNLAATGDALRTKLLPALEEYFDKSAQFLGPALVNGLTGLVQFFSSLIGQTGPLTVLVTVIGDLARGLAWVFNNVPGARELITALVLLKLAMYGAAKARVAWTKAEVIGRVVQSASATAYLRYLYALDKIKDVYKAIRLQMALYRAALILNAQAAWAAVASNARLAASWVAQKAAAVGSAIATGAMTVATWGYNAAMVAAAAATWSLDTALAILLSPVFLVIAAVVALIAAVYLAYTKWKWFHDAVNNVWAAIKTGVSSAVGWTVRAFGNMVSFMKTLPGKIGSAISGLWDGFKNGGKEAINFIIGLFNTGIRAINSATPGAIKAFGHTIVPAIPDIPEIPTLAKGGTIMLPGQQWISGEAGAELGTVLPGGGVNIKPIKGTRKFSMPEGKSFVDKNGQIPGFGDITLHSYTVVDGQVIAETVSKHVSSSQARA